MLAVDRTTKQFVASVKATAPGARIVVDKSRTRHGRSNYVYVYLADRMWKVRISDHPVGMRRALWGLEDLLLDHQAKPASWAVWMGEHVARHAEPNPADGVAPLRTAP